MTSLVVRSLCWSAACLSLFSTTAMADLVGPGQTIHYYSLNDDSRDPNPDFDLVARNTRDVTFDYGHGRKLSFTFENYILRNPANQHLTFVFGPTKETGVGFYEGWTMQYENVGNEPVNVHSYSDLTIQDVAGKLDILASVYDGPYDPILIVDTNATKFDQNGTIQLYGADEFYVPDAEDQDYIQTLGARHLFDGVYQPVFSETPPASVPLPPAAYGGFALLAAVIATRLGSVKG
jgi:hypothetical protein